MKTSGTESLLCDRISRLVEHAPAMDGPDFATAALPLLMEANNDIARLREIIAGFNAEVAECNYPVQYLAVEIDNG